MIRTRATRSSLKYSKYHIIIVHVETTGFRSVKHYATWSRIPVVLSSKTIDLLQVAAAVRLNTECLYVTLSHNPHVYDRNRLFYSTQLY